MSESELAAICCFCRVMQHSPAHPCTQRAGIGLFANIKNYFCKICLYYTVLHSEFVAKVCNFGIIAPCKAHING